MSSVNYVMVTSYTDYDISISVDGIRYVYTAYPKYSGYDLNRQFSEISKISNIEALNWISENANLVSKYGGE